MSDTWNPFSWYLHIITRVNFMVEPIPKDKIRHNLELSKHSVHSKILNNHKKLESSDSLENNSWLCSNCKRDLFCSSNSSKIGTLTSTTETNSCAKPECRFYLHTQARYIQTAASSDVTINSTCRLSNDRSCALTIRSFFTRRKGTSPLDSIECSSIQLSFFFLLVSSATILMVKLLLYSTVWSHRGVLGDFKLVKYENSTGLNNNQDYIQVAQSIYDLIICDLFTSFSNSRLFNLIALTSLSPSTIARLMHLIKLFIELILKKNSSSQTTRYLINTVQLDLSYLYSLRTTTGDWLQLIIKSWYHKHKFDINQYEKLKSTLNIPKADVDFLSNFDLKTKLYIYNMIQFDYCYSNYFTLESSSTTLNSIAHSSEDNIKNVSKRKTSMDKNSDDKKYEESRNSTNIENIFVARPIHRMDIYEMAWLVAMLIVLYTLSIFSILMPIICCFALEMNIKTFDQLKVLRDKDVFKMIMVSFSVGRWMQLFVWQCLVILAIFDLFNFFSCCLICYSRARYLKLELRQILTHCKVINTERRKRSIQKLVGEYGLVSKDAEGRTRSLYGRSQIRIFDDLNSEINKKAELIVDWILLLQRELIDVKKFFSNYLSLEIILKVICLIFAFSAVILAKGHVFENVFLVINANTAATPVFIVIITATLIESEFRGICKTMDEMLYVGREILAFNTRKKIIIHATYLSSKVNRSIVIGGSYALSLGSLLPVFGWIASGIVLLRRT